MDKKLVLKIKTLGRLHITDGENEFPQEKKRSAQVELLIVYLILNRNANITNPQLIDFLWPDGNADKPEGALRNLIYRARKEMKQFFKEVDCIKSKGRSYYWNPEVECRVDYEEMLIFKNIYQINVRSARRSMKARILTLLTIVDTSGCLDEKAIRQEADILREVISNSLRKNDVYSKFNMTQYSLILASPDLDGAKIAVDRITNRYNEKKKHDEIILTNDLKKIR